MKLELDTEWCLDCDTDSVQLIKKVVIGAAQKGKPVKEENIGKIRLENYGFYGNLEQALTAYLQKKVGSVQGEATAAQIIDMWAKCCEVIKEACKNLPLRGIVK